MISNKDLRVEDGNIIINGEKHPLDPAVDALIKRANTVQGKLSALDTRLDAIEALEKTASGNPISLTGVAEAYAMALNMTIEPIQSGSGVPSPTNVRPISGLTSGEVTTTNGEDTNTASITFGKTVYGGSVNFKTGEVTVTKGYDEFDGSSDEDWSLSSNRFIATLSSETSADITNVNVSFCNAYDGETMRTLYANRETAGWTGVAGASTSLYIVDNVTFPSTKDETAWRTHLASNPLQVCYELATPTTLTLTPAELELLKGANTISGNGVTINISYLGR